MAAFWASCTDAVVTVPANMAAALAEPLALRTFAPPVKTPRVDVSQYWHERFHREPGSQWIRGLFASLFSSPDPQLA